MSAQVALRAYLNELLDNAAKDRADEAPEAWGNLEKLVRSESHILLCRKTLTLGSITLLEWHLLASMPSMEPSGVKESLDHCPFSVLSTLRWLCMAA